MSAPSAGPGATLAGNGTTSTFDQDYVLDKRLRSGSYGVVFTTRHKVTNEEFAVKVIDRTKLKKKDDDATFREVGIMKDLRNVDHIVKLIDFYMEPKTFHVVQSHHIISKTIDVGDGCKTLTVIDITTSIVGN